MAIWRDPLDELIEDLEKAVPEAQGPIVPDLFALEDMQVAIGPILWGDKAAIERSKSDPGAQRFWAWVEARAKLVDGAKAAATPVDDDVSILRFLEDEP